MKAIIHGAGSGSRLKPLTNYLPKVLVPVGFKPMIEHVIEIFSIPPIDEIIVDHKHPLVKEYFRSVPHATKVTPVSVSGRGTAMDLVELADRMGPERFFLSNGDIVASRFDIGEMLDYDGNVMALLEVGDRAEYGSVEMDTTGGILKYQEKTGVHEVGLAYLGICLIETSLIEVVKSRGFESLERDVFPYLVERGELNGCIFEDIRWIDVGTFERIREATEFLGGMKDRTLEGSQ